MVDLVTVNFNTDVIGFYHKQKSEFHFQQKTDNEFLMFLLDTAVRVISIVQHLAPVIEAVSEASNEAEEALEEEEYNLQQQLNQQHQEQLNQQHQEQFNQQHQQHQEQQNEAAAVMEVDNLAEELIKDRIDFVVVPPPPPDRDPTPQEQASLTHIAEKMIAEQLLESFNSQPISTQSVPISIPLQSTPIKSVANQSTTLQSISSLGLPSHSTPINVPISIPVSVSTTHPSESEKDIKTERPIPEIIEIKEEPERTLQPLLPDEQLQQLMSSISNNEDNMRIQNFIPTAQPSNLPQSFLDRNNNPLSMLSLSSGSKPPPLLSAPFDSNLFANISTDGLPGTSGSLDSKTPDGKGSLNPKHQKTARPRSRNIQCEHCGQSYLSRCDLRRHITAIHLKLKPFQCPFCEFCSARKGNLRSHLKSKHSGTNPGDVEIVFSLMSGIKE